MELFGSASSQFDPYMWMVQGMAKGQDPQTLI